MKDVVISDELFGKFVSDVAAYTDKIDTVCLCRDGEPLLDKKLPQRIRTLKDCGIANTTISTNVQLLTEETAESLLDAGLDELMLSIDAVSGETFEKIRKNLSFDRVVNNALRAVSLRNRKRSRTKFRIRMVVTRDNRHEVDAWLRFWKKHASRKDTVQAKEAHSWGNQLVRESRSDIEVFSEVPCIAPFNMLTIHFNGHVVMCGHDFRERHLVGDFNRHTIREIWHGKRISAIRQLHLAGNRNHIGMCRGCAIWDRKPIA
jgi:radical SAM protein with 4Fe4S-binding SPASM domain